MAGVYDINHKGKQILCVDIAGLQIKDKQEFQKYIEQAKAQIRQRSPKSLLIITYVANTGFDSEIATVMKEYATHNTPFVKASAVVGISGWQKVVLTAIKTLTGRDYYVTDSLDDAKEWLVKQ